MVASSGARPAGAPLAGGLAFDVPDALRDEDALAAHQVRELNRVLARARDTPFYRARLSGLPERVDSVAELARYPPTTKADVLADGLAHPPYGSRVRAGRRAIRHVVTTSGTSGAGQEIYPMDAEDEEVVHRMAARGFAWAGVDDDSVVLDTLPLTTTAAGQWYFHGLRLLGATVLCVGTYATERKLEELARFGADTIVGTPSYLLRMAVVAVERGTPAAGLGVRRLVVAGESWSEAWLSRLEALWAAPVFEQYGSTQRAMAWSCPRGALPGGTRGALHALSDHGVYEVVDPESGAPVADGPGELVITPFQSGASPLVRFRTGDRVVVAGPCPCGRPGPRLVAGLADRFDFMVKVRGVNVWPEALDGAIFGVAGVREYTAAVARDDGGREALTVELELELDGADPHAAGAVVDAVRRRVGLNADVVIVAPGSITGDIQGRFAKRRRLVDRRKAT